MSKNIETGLILVKDDVLKKIRKSIFSILFRKENELLQMLNDMERPRNKVSGKIIIPKEIKRSSVNREVINI